MTDVWVHHWPGIDWHRQRVKQLQVGLQALGLNPKLTSLRVRADESPAVLLGTTFWHDIENDELPSLLVDRASWGDPDQVQLVWNGRLRRGDHRVPDDYQARPRPYPEPKPLQEGDRVVLCGQVTGNGAKEPLADWYQRNAKHATHFKPHPAGSAAGPEHLPATDNWINTGLALTFNSSVGVWCLLNGIGVLADDPGAMIYDYAHNGMGVEECLSWIAWTQWSWDEIALGEPIRHHFFNGESYRF